MRSSYTYSNERSLTLTQVQSRVASEQAQSILKEIERINLAARSVPWFMHDMDCPYYQTQGELMCECKISDKPEKIQPIKIVKPAATELIHIFYMALFVAAVALIVWSAWGGLADWISAKGFY